MQKTQISQRTYSTTHKPATQYHKISKSSLFTSSEKEAIQIFNQVTSNKNQIFAKDSNSFYSKKTIKFLKPDSNGLPFTESFEAISFCGFTSTGEPLAEVVQNYQNEKTGTEKSSIHRVVGDKSRKYEIKKTLEIESINDCSENCGSEFDELWKKGAKELGVRKVSSFQKKANSLFLGR